MKYSKNNTVELPRAYWGCPSFFKLPQIRNPPLRERDCDITDVWYLEWISTGTPFLKENREKQLIIFILTNPHTKFEVIYDYHSPCKLTLFLLYTIRDRLLYTLLWGFTPYTGCNKYQFNDWKKKNSACNLKSSSKKFLSCG